MNGDGILKSAFWLMLALFLAACSHGVTTSQGSSLEPGSGAWFAWVENQVMTADSLGHGPDPGSDEWKSAIEFQLGVTESQDVPDPASASWYSYINELLLDRQLAARQALGDELPGIGPLTFICGPSSQRLLVTFYQTDPSTLVLEWQNEVYLMYSQPVASGARYQGEGGWFWEHQNEARLRWGLEPEMQCYRRI